MGLLMRSTMQVFLLVFLWQCSSYNATTPAPRQGADQRDKDEDDERQDDRWGNDETTGIDFRVRIDDDVTDDGSDSSRTSGGSGGPTGLQEVNYTDTAGTRSRYKIDAPSDVHSKTYGLHIHLHGDGGGGYRDFPNQKPAHNLIGVTVRAPSLTLQWGRRQGAAHGKFVHDLIQEELLKKYDVALDRIYFSGVSGGAYFLTGSFIPDYGAQYAEGGAMILCGGEAPRTRFRDEDFLKSFRIHYQMTNGERNDIKRSVERSISAYQDAIEQVDGANAESILTTEYDGRGGHCVFDGRSYTSGIQYIIDEKFDVILP